MSAAASDPIFSIPNQRFSQGATKNLVLAASGLDRGHGPMAASRRGVAGERGVGRPGECPTTDRRFWFVSLCLLASGCGWQIRLGACPCDTRTEGISI